MSLMPIAVASFHLRVRDNAICVDSGIFHDVCEDCAVSSGYARMHDVEFARSERAIQVDVSFARIRPRDHGSNEIAITNQTSTERSNHKSTQTPARFTSPARSSRFTPRGRVIHAAFARRDPALRVVRAPVLAAPEEVEVGVAQAREAPAPVGLRIP
jgi:hypothetical protein